MLGLVVAMVFVLVVGLGVLGGYTLVAMKQRIDEDRALDDANMKRQSDALHTAKGGLSTWLAAVSLRTKKVQEAQGDAIAKVGAVESKAAKLETSVGTHTADIEKERTRLNSHIIQFNSDVMRLDGVDTALSDRVGELEVLAPVVRRLTIESDGIKVCGFDSASCKKIMFAPV
jgi:hypothetical protein